MTLEPIIKSETKTPCLNPETIVQRSKSYEFGMAENCRAANFAYRSFWNFFLVSKQCPVPFKYLHKTMIWGLQSWSALHSSHAWFVSLSHSLNAIASRRVSTLKNPVAWITCRTKFENWILNIRINCLKKNTQFELISLALYLFFLFRDQVCFITFLEQFLLCDNLIM